MGQHGQQGAERNQWLLQTFIRQAQRLLSITEGEWPQLEHFAECHTSDLRSVNVSVCLREDSRPQDCGGVEKLDVCLWWQQERCSDWLGPLGTQTAGDCAAEC